MHPKLRKTVLIGGLAAVLVTAAAAQVVHHTGPSRSLEARWSWALMTASEKGCEDGFWVGYSIRKVMDAFTYFGSTGSYVFTTSRPSLFFMRGTPLGEMVYGAGFSPLNVSAENSIRAAAREALNELEGSAQPRRRIERDLAFLFHFDAGGTAAPDQVRFSHLEVPFDSEGAPLFWVDRASDAESFALVAGLFPGTEGLKEKKRLLRAAALHEDSTRVVPFLENILEGREPDEVRAGAASALGEQNCERSVTLLRKAAGSDRSLAVRKRAVSGLEDLRRPEAVDALIELSRIGEPREIRKRAISALGDVASRKAEAALGGMAYGGEDSEIQKRAVYALEDLPDFRGIPHLIRIARTHPNLKVRKAAISSLGDSDDPRARAALIDLARGR